MPPSAESERETHEESAVTLAELLCHLPDPALRSELEEYRVKYEAKFGNTDLTKRYTCTWPTEHQNWLLEHHPKRYWAGLPPFVQAFFRAKMRTAHRDGNLDDMPTSFIPLFLAGEMQIGGTGRSR